MTVIHLFDKERLTRNCPGCKHDYMTEAELQALVLEWASDLELDLKAFETDELVARILDACGVETSDSH